MDAEQRIYSADEARRLLDDATPGPWAKRSGRITRVGGLGIGAMVTEVCTAEDFTLLAAAPDLAASVEHHAARADAAERERDALRVRVAELTAALRFCACECARCSRPGVWITFNGIVWCDEHKECGVVHHREPQPIEHADVLRSLGARDGAT